MIYDALDFASLLTFHFLNVNHGDSIVIEYQNDGQKAIGVIDSNISGSDTTPPALRKLESLGVENLSFIALTHPHVDHFLGLSQIIDRYRDNISNFYSFPLNAYLPGRVRKLSEIYQKIHAETDSPALKRTIKEFVKILYLAKKHFNADIWQEPNGCDNIIAPDGFQGVSISVILPHPKHKGPFFQMIEKGSSDIVGMKNLNELSMAFHIKYGGCEIILGGDGTNSSWLDHITYTKKRGIQIGGNIIKLPHHGSGKDCTEKNIDHLFTEDDEDKIACISANGRSHPHPDIFKILSKKNIKPYCTNLSNICGANITELSVTPGMSPVLNRFICLVEEPGSKSIQPCQGDISISVHKHGQIDIQTQYSNMCPYRGDFDFLAAGQ